MIYAVASIGNRLRESKFTTHFVLSHSTLHARSIAVASAMATEVLPGLVGMADSRVEAGLSESVLIQLDEQRNHIYKRLKNSKIISMMPWVAALAR